MVKPEGPWHQSGGLLSPAQIAIGEKLQSYYQLHCVGPTPERLRMLLNELQRRTEKSPPKDKADR